MNQTSISIRFPQGMFSELHNRLLEDQGKEAFSLLLARRETAGDQTILKVLGSRYPRPEDYESQGLAHLRLKREYVYRILVEMQQQGEADTLIDVHTHPFCSQGVAFSGVDDRDEKTFHRWLTDTLDDVNYASIVLSQSDYSARLWQRSKGQFRSIPAYIRTQTVGESWPCADHRASSEDDLLAATNPKTGFLARSALALGLDTLRHVMHEQSIAVVGVGGLGSIIAENLLHTGFQHIHLIDPDQVEMTNLNRIVGAYHDDALENRLKVNIIRDHLLRINPKASIIAHPTTVEDETVLPVLAAAHWIIVGTDNHLSRFTAQQIALRYAVPLVSAGVNISVEQSQITDMSGEVILARYGDGLCLNCLGRINPTTIAAERYQGQPIGEALVSKGYVSGQEVKEPAVKTLNAILGAITVDSLLNQYTQRQAHTPLIVYETNKQPLIYPDTHSITARHKSCFHCSRLT